MRENKIFRETIEFDLSLLKRDKLSYFQRLLYAWIASRPEEDRKRGVAASNEFLSKRFLCSEKTITNGLKALEDACLILMEDKKVSRRIFIVEDLEQSK